MGGKRCLKKKKKRKKEASVEIKDGQHKQLAPNQTISFIAADVHNPDQPVTGSNETKNRKQTNKKHASDLRSLWVGTGGGGLRAQALSGNIRLCAFALSVEVADPR